MGLRGPLRNPNSRRGRAEAKAREQMAVMDGTSQPKSQSVLAMPSPETREIPPCPDWLSAATRKIYNGLVSELIAASVPIKSIDSHAIAMAAQCLNAIRETEGLVMDQELDAEKRLMALRLNAQYGRDLKDWLQLICATPGSRARIGVTSEPKKKLGPLAQLLAARQKRAN